MKTIIYILIYFNHMDKNNLDKEVKVQSKLKTCNLCGCNLQSKNFARHLKTKKHKDVDRAYNKFEMEKYEPPASKNTDFIVLR